MMRRKKKKSRSLGTITVIESRILPYKVGSDLASLLALKFVDGTSPVAESLLVKFMTLWNPKVISQAPDYQPAGSDGRVIRVDTVLGRMQDPEKAEVLRRVLITIRSGAPIL